MPTKNIQDNTHQHIPQAAEQTTAQLVVIGDGLLSTLVWPVILSVWKEKNAAASDIDRLEILEHPDADEALSIEVVRTIQQNIAYAVAGNQFRHVVIHRAETASLPAQQALLKMLEDGALRTQWWLVTASERALLPTIQSRCQISSVRQLLSPADIGELEKKSAVGIDYDPTEISALLGRLTELHAGEIMDLSQKYTKRAVVRSVLKYSLQHFHGDLPARSSAPRTLTLEQIAFRNHALAITLDCLEKIDANVSPRMVFEHWLLNLIRNSSRTGRKAGSVI